MVGCGRAAHKHIKAITGIEGSKLAAVCDIDPSKAESLGRQYAIPYYNSYDEMFTNESADIVIISTPSGMHPEHVVNIARKFKKTIICEKPIALSLEDADLMIRTCVENECRLFIVNQYKFKKTVCELKKAVDTGALGKLFLGTVRVRWRRDQQYYDRDSWRGTLDLDGGIIMNQALHHIDLLTWIMGEPLSVMAKKATYGVDIEADNTALAIITFKNGAMGLIEATTATVPSDLEGSISILGERGTVILGGFSADTIVTWNIVGQTENDKRHVLTSSSNMTQGQELMLFIENVIECLRNNLYSMAEGLENRKSLVLLKAIRESASTGREVFIDDFPNDEKERSYEKI